MKEKELRLWKRILIDVLGVMLLIGAVLFGWIPGPGGIPLFLAGLGLLSINHNWARRLLQRAKSKGSNLYDLFFPDNQWVYLFYDLVGILAGSTAIYLILNLTNSLYKSIAVAILFVSIGLVLTNRRRLEKINNFIKRNKA